MANTGENLRYNQRAVANWEGCRTHMPRVILTHHDQRIVLPYGETLVGRAVECRLRFNDSAVSRRHLAIYSSAETAMVENLSRTNGSQLNGDPLTTGRRRLSDGDQIQIGYRILTVHLAVDEQSESRPVVVSQTREAAPGLLVDEDTEYTDEVTLPGGDPSASLIGNPRAKSVAEDLASAAFDMRNCPRCRSLVSSFEDQCSGCGYEWPAGLPVSRTQEINLDGLTRRADPRYAVKVPVIYSSESLTLDGVVRDLSRGGMYIATELLDPVGTECRVTALPDGHGALTFAGTVCHVATGPNRGRPPGIGIAFTSKSPAAEDWLKRTLRHASELSM